MSTTKYYRGTCGAIYKVTTSPATRQVSQSTTQARRSQHAPEFGPSYATHPAEVARLVAFGSFVEVPAP